MHLLDLDKIFTYFIILSYFWVIVKLQNYLWLSYLIYSSIQCSNFYFFCNVHFSQPTLPLTPTCLPSTNLFLKGTFFHFCTILVLYSTIADRFHTWHFITLEQLFIFSSSSSSLSDHANLHHCHGLLPVLSLSPLRWHVSYCHLISSPHVLFPLSLGICDYIIRFLSIP